MHDIGFRYSNQQSSRRIEMNVINHRRYIHLQVIEQYNAKLEHDQSNWDECEVSRVDNEVKNI